jgi:hypothetical protein
LVDGLRFLEVWQQPVLPQLNELARALLNVAAVLGIAALVGLGVWILYRLAVWQVWVPWNRRSQAEFLAACVASSVERLRAGTVLSRRS